MTATDWTAAPEWATYLSKDGDGVRFWWQERPIPSTSSTELYWVKNYAWQKCERADGDGPADNILTLERRP